MSSKRGCGSWWAYDGLASYFRSLPSDDEMIENFYKHRADFERLVRAYRGDCSVPVDDMYGLRPTPEIKAIMARINVRRISGDGVSWTPSDPHSKDRNGEESALKPEWSPPTRQLSGVVFAYAHRHVRTLKDDAVVTKKYHYTPLVPKVRYHVFKRNGQAEASQTLNGYLPQFHTCMYRPIDMHWYIETCHSD